MRMTTTLLNLASIASGLFFFAWPLRMNQSGLSGAGAMVAYASIAFVCAMGGLLLAPGTFGELRGRALTVGLQAGVLNVIGVLAFTYMLSHVSRLQAPRSLDCSSGSSLRSPPCSCCDSDVAVERTARALSLPALRRS